MISLPKRLHYRKNLKKFLSLFHLNISMSKPYCIYLSLISSEYFNFQSSTLLCICIISIDDLYLFRASI